MIALRWGTAIGLLFLTSCSSPAQSPNRTTAVQPHQGDLSKRGGTPTVRKSYEPQPDNPSTTNDESNDQPVGHFGTVTLIASQEESGHTYTLDVELDGLEAKRIYFPKGGWVDLQECELEDDHTGDCMDENGRHWMFEGERELRPK